MTAFAVQDPKLREIFAPGFRDRLAQHWLISVIGPTIERAWIDDCFSNRVGKGTHGYVDDMILLGDNPRTLLEQMRRIDRFLQERLQLRLHPDKTVLQRVDQGANFLGYIVFPHYRYVRERTLRALRSRIHFFNALFDPACYPQGSRPQRGTWVQWLTLHQLTPPLAPSPVVLKRMLATLNSYYGQLRHADTYRLRRKIYHEMLGPIRRYFLPVDADYGALRIKPVWLFASSGDVMTLRVFRDT